MKSVDHLSKFADLICLKTLLFGVSMFAFCFSCAVPGIAQDTQNEFPPPLKILSKEEKSALKIESDVKKHTVLTLDLMDARLMKAESYKEKEEYRLMFDELGGFNALMDDTLDFLNQKNKNSGKVLDNFKRIDLILRKYLTRLELIRRDLPPEYEPYVRRLVKYVREARSKAIEPMFDKAILPDNDNEK